MSEEKAKDGVQISFVEPGVTEIKQEDLLKHIEYCGRTCYNSLDKITDTSAEKFVRNLVARGHGSVLEHGTVYFLFPSEMLPNDTPDGKIQRSPYSFSVPKDEYSYYLTTNFRVVAEAFDMDFDRAYNYVLMNGMDCTEHQRRRTFKIVCDRGVSHEMVRHRVFSFSQASQRYINSTKAGFEFVKPYWWMDSFEGATLTEKVTQMLFEQECRNCSASYQALIECGFTPQQARGILPNATKTELVVTGTEEQWGEFLRLRTDKAAHPDMQIIANKIKELL